MHVGQSVHWKLNRNSHYVHIGKYTTYEIINGYTNFNFELHPEKVLSHRCEQNFATETVKVAHMGNFPQNHNPGLSYMNGTAPKNGYKQV